MEKSKLTSEFEKIGTSLFDNNLPIYLDKRSIKRVSDNSYTYTTIHNISNWKTYNISDSSGYNRLRADAENRNTQSYVDRTNIDDDAVVEIVDKRDTNRLS